MSQNSTMNQTNQAFVCPGVPLGSRRVPALSGSRPYRSRYCRPHTAPVASVAASVISNTTATGGRRRVSFPGLRSERFRHPFDVRATRALSSLFGLEALLRSVLATAAQAMFLENISRGVLVSERQMPGLYRSLQEACHVLDMRVPQLYVRQHAVPNAYTLAVQGKRAFIVLHSALLDLLTEEEIQAVISHECGHLKAEHGIWITAANLIMLLATGLLGGALGGALAEFLNLQLLRWSRAAEFSCDRAALLVTQNPKVVMSALMKLAGGSRRFASELDVDEFVRQAEEFDAESRRGFGSFIRMQLTQSTHPLPVLRVRELQRWADSNYFRSLLSSGRPLEDAAEKKEPVPV